MKIFYPRYLGLSSLLLVIYLSSNVNAQIGEQDDASRVNVQTGETDRDLPDETPTLLDTVESQQEPEGEEAAVPPITERAWIYSFEDTGISSEMIEFDGTKSFIVVYKEPDPNEVGNAEDIIAATDFAVQSAVIRNGGSVSQEFTTVINGVAADLTMEAMNALMEQDGIAFIEEDTPVFISTTWGQDRIDQPNRPGDGRYIWKGNKIAGEGVNVAIIDTGIRDIYLQPGDDRKNKHMDLVGGYDVFSQSITPSAWDDCHSHGTHVAGTVGSIEYGVAPGARIWAVRVLGCNGGGTSSTVVGGIEWVVQQKRSLGGKWVMNLSLGGGFNNAQNNAVNAARNEGIIVVVAAGNNGNTDNPLACNYSPASAALAITVGSTTSTDARSSFSNIGSCLDIFAPGSSVLSLSLTGTAETPGTSTKSGTSMASPHVAGVAALFFQISNTANAAEMALFNAAVSGKVTSEGSQSPNMLVQVPLTLQTCPQSQTVRLTLKTDPWSVDDNYYTIIRDGASSPVMSAPVGYFKPKDQPYVEDGCLPNGQYTFTIYDLYGDGLEQGGFFDLRVGGSVIFSSANIPNVWKVATHRFTIGTTIPPPSPTPAPTKVPSPAPTKAPTPVPTKAPTTAPTPVPTKAPTKAPTPAPAQTPAPTKAPTKAPTNAPTKAPTKAPTPAPTPPTSTISCTPGEIDFEFRLVTDDYSFEDNGYRLQRQGSTAALFNRAVGSVPSGRGRTLTERLCLGEGTYTLTVQDEYQDGLCCMYGIGLYEVRFNGVRQAGFSSPTGSDTAVQLKWGPTVTHKFTTVKVVMRSDLYSVVDNHFTIRNRTTNAIVYSRVKGTYNGPSGTVYEDLTFLPPGNYRFQFFDDPWSPGSTDGLCCTYGNGYFQLYISGVLQTGVQHSWAGPPTSFPTASYDSVTYDFTIS
ncbi:peptidase S8a subtilisin subfamily protein [Nitzschia inconspicua]|uniref:Peptidase S8a subtilisin subfamily protein n=1 Tax=Nitzschia inconspicua TaxID=303405 RepID=A0A9K3KD39_9STRA|nr:peptidase S8a subtilisin subfamily protein [Nitzschia inconspicua]